MNRDMSRKIRDLQAILLGGSRPLLAIALALLIGAIWILAEGSNPIVAYKALLKGAFGSVISLANTGVRTAPLLLAGLGVAYGFKAGLFNVGAEGQLYLGAAAATLVGIVDLPVPAWLHLLITV